MLEQRAQVVAILPGKVELAVALQSSCSHCHSADTCGSGTVARAFSAKSQQLIVETSLELARGQWVRLGIEQRGVLALAAVTYLLPLLGLIWAGALGQLWLVESLGYGEPVAMGLALTGALAAWGVSRTLAGRIAARMQQPTILGTIANHLP